MCFPSDSFTPLTDFFQVGFPPLKLTVHKGTSGIPDSPCEQLAWKSFYLRFMEGFSDPDLGYNP